MTSGKAFDATEALEFHKNFTDIKNLPPEERRAFATAIADSVSAITDSVNIAKIDQHPTASSATSPRSHLHLNQSTPSGSSKKVQFSNKVSTETIGNPTHPTEPSPLLSPRRTNKLRLALLCSGVCSERLLQKLDGWNFEVVLIAEIDPSLAAFARIHFPRAYVTSDVRKIPDLVASGDLTVTADVGMATFPCQSQSVLKELNGYADLSTADMFRDSLRFKIMNCLKIEFLMEENVPPNPNTTRDYDHIQKIAREYGCRTQIDIVDAACFGGAQSRLRALWTRDTSTSSYGK